MGTATSGPTPVPAEQRFWPKVQKGEPWECWPWTGKKSELGYGQFWLGNTKHRTSELGPGMYRAAHRVAWQLTYGSEPPLELDHLCRNRLCCNPAHLQPVAHRVNVLRGLGPTAENARLMVCRNGHPFDEANTVVRADGHRRCRTCRNEYMLVYKRKWRRRHTSPR